MKILKIGYADNMNIVQKQAKHQKKKNDKKWNLKSDTFRWVGYVVRMGEKTNSLRALMCQLSGKRQVNRLRCRWVDNIEPDVMDQGAQIALEEWL